MIPTKSTAATKAAASNGPLMTLRIIVFALAAGVGSYGAFVVSQNIGKPHVLAAKLDSQNLVLLALGLVALVCGLFASSVFFARSRGSAALLAPGMEATPQDSRRLAIQQRIQTSTIIACALFEGAAFANLFGYSQSRELLHLVLAGFLLLGILAQFPTTGGYERKIDDELRRLNEEQAFQRAP